MCGVLVTGIILCDHARCDGNRGKLEPKRGGSVLVPVTGLPVKEKSSQSTPKGTGVYICRPRLLQTAASTAQEIFLLKVFFQLIAKEEMVTDAGRRQILPTPDKSR